MDDQYWIDKFGEYKKIQDLESGKWYKVPTLHIVRNGITQYELKNFPEWLTEA